MGSPLSSVVDEFFMEGFKLEVLNEASLRPKLYKCFVDDMLLIWTHGHKTLAGFVDFLGSSYRQIQFTMELEHDGILPFLVIQFNR